MEQGQNSNQGAYQTQAMEQTQEQYQSNQQTQSMPKADKREFAFSFEKQNALDTELRKPRSRAYMEIFDAIDMLSSTDEEIIEQLKSKMDEDTAEEFANMTMEELLEEIKACFQEEFENLEVDIQAVMHGVISKCYIDGCDVHAISSEGEIIEHFSTAEPMPEELKRGRIVFKKFPNCRCVEVYSDCCRVVNDDSTVIQISNREIDC